MEGPIEDPYSEAGIGKPLDIRKETEEHQRVSASDPVDTEEDKSRVKEDVKKLTQEIQAVKPEPEKDIRKKFSAPTSTSLSERLGGK